MLMGSSLAHPPDFSGNPSFGRCQIQRFWCCQIYLYTPEALNMESIKIPQLKRKIILDETSMTRWVPSQLESCPKNHLTPSQNIGYILEDPNTCCHTGGPAIPPWSKAVNFFWNCDLSWISDCDPRPSFDVWHDIWLTNIKGPTVRGYETSNRS